MEKKAFVTKEMIEKIVEKYPFDMDMKRGRYIVDAKSLLGLMNLGFDQKIELKVYDEECDDLWKELDKFVAAQGCSYVEKDGQ